MVVFPDTNETEIGTVDEIRLSGRQSASSICCTEMIWQEHIIISKPIQGILGPTPRIEWTDPQHPKGRRNDTVRVPLILSIP